MKLINRFYLILFGIFLSILLIEFSLRFASFIYRNYKIVKKSYLPNNQSVIKILCLGDSFTFGEGAPKGYSYPEQLEKMLNDTFKDKLKFIVYNAGIPGSNSSYISNHLEENINKYKPDIVVIMTGCNNSNNFLENNYFLFTNFSIRNYIYRIDAFLSNLKTYKLIKTAIVNLSFKLSNFLPKFNFKQTNNREMSIVSNSKKKMILDIPLEMRKKIDEYFQLAITYEERKEITLAIEQCKKILELNPYEIKAYILLGRIYIHRCPFSENTLYLAISTLKKALEIDPLNLEARWELINAYYRCGLKEEALRELKIFQKISPNNPIVKYLLLFGIPDYKDKVIFERVLNYDLNNIVRKISNYNIKLILQSYHMHFHKDTIEKIARKYNIPFVDNEKVFKNLDSKKNYYAQDGHLNAEGYKIIAENVYNVLVNEVLKLN